MSSIPCCVDGGHWDGRQPPRHLDSSSREGAGLKAKRRPLAQERPGSSFTCREAPACRGLAHAGLLRLGMLRSRLQYHCCKCSAIHKPASGQTTRVIRSKLCKAFSLWLLDVCCVTKVGTCAGVKAVQQNNPPPGPAPPARYRIALSDGEVWCTAMLGTALNDLIKSSALVVGTIVQILDYLQNTVHGKKYGPCRVLKRELLSACIA